MKLLSIEPTPSPNTMKLNIDETLPQGVRRTYTADSGHIETAPQLIRTLLAIPGVRSVFCTANFISVDRKGNADWQAILAAAREAFGGDAADAGLPAEGAGFAEAFGEAHVLLQVFRGIPMQVRVRAGGEEARAGLPQRFADAVAQAAGATMIRERKLEELGVRYGEPRDIAEEVAQETDAAYTDERLAELVRAAAAMGASGGEAPPERRTERTAGELAVLLGDADWRVRYAALEQMKPSAELLPLLAQAIRDEKSSIRRLAVVYLGDLKSQETFPLLFEALRDDSASVRRTAGDTLSDIGDPAAVGPMCEALKDPNKLVRWRAARFLYEAGDETALDALRAAADDPEFEVSLQVKIAIERIESGEEAAGSVWQQMTNRKQ